MIRALVRTAKSKRGDGPGMPELCDHSPNSNNRLLRTPCRKLAILNPDISPSILGLRAFRASAVNQGWVSPPGWAATFPMIGNLIGILSSLLCTRTSSTILGTICLMTSSSLSGEFAVESTFEDWHSSYCTPPRS